MTRLQTPTGFIIALLLLACSSSPGPRGPSEGETEVIGVAFNRERGAVIEIEGDTTIYYVADLPHWPDELHGRRLVVIGKIAAREQPAAKTGEPSITLRDARWRPESP